MIDIIIPVYNSADNLRYALLSVAMQNVKDIITVYIIDDASDCNYNKIIEEFSKDIKIEYYRLKSNSGAGVARQYGINVSKNKYIAFLDSDDSLYNPRSIEVLYNAISKGLDYVSSNEYDERFNLVDDYYSDLHGKIYSREYLISKNITFNNARIYEDCYFNNLVLISDPKKEKVEEITYLYAYNEQSTTAVTYEEFFKRVENCLSTFRAVLDFSYINNWKADNKKMLTDEKCNFIKKVYNKASGENRIILKGWIKKYNLVNELANVYTH